MADRPSRKLAVILHADVVGSTELVQRDESIAHERIQAGFRSFSETIRAYGGITREIRGDALVAEFARASDAVTAALSFQAKNTDDNARLEDDIRPELRIGISLGEVIVADNTVTGAGVVLAQRLEQLAPPGGVIVQGSVSETVPRRLPFDFDNLGEQSVKGFDQPVRAFVAQVRPGARIPDAESKAVTPEPETHVPRERPPAKLPDKPSIVVLPFANMSSDPEQEYFSDGVSEDIITDLSKMSGLFVIARNSAFVYKGKSSNIPDVCRELGVRFALEGSIRKAGNRVRITAQLIDGTTGGHIWAERYDRELADIFAVQDEVTREIVAALAPKLTKAEQQTPRREPTDNLEAYDWFLRGREQWWRLTKQTNADARKMFERAIELDPNFAMATAFLAGTHLIDHFNQWSESAEQSVRLHAELARRAVALNDQDSFARVQLGMAHMAAMQHE
ncbi:MAG: adenylate/guanylate cyclase domain-containing protein, partial [Rhodothermales bacterium]|nr:adenylate/guanylate cyclase domain-containing protein [Rhodothermales bacterium]